MGKKFKGGDPANESHLKRPFKSKRKHYFIKTRVIKALLIRNTNRWLTVNSVSNCSLIHMLFQEYF